MYQLRFGMEGNFLVWLFKYINIFLFCSFFGSIIYKVGFFVNNNSIFLNASSLCKLQHYTIFFKEYQHLRHIWIVNYCSYLIEHNTPFSCDQNYQHLMLSNMQIRFHNSSQKVQLVPRKILKITIECDVDWIGPPQSLKNCNLKMGVSKYFFSFSYKVMVFFIP